MASDTTESTTFDAAALAVATAAGAITAVISPGPYGQLSLMIGATLLVTIWAYEYSRIRRWPQSLALSMSSAFISLLIIGFFWEWLFTPSGLVGICPVNGQTYNFDCQKDPESAINIAYLTVVWFVLTIAFLVIDLSIQRRRSR